MVLTIVYIKNLENSIEECFVLFHRKFQTLIAVSKIEESVTLMCEMCDQRK